VRRPLGRGREERRVQRARRPRFGAREATPLTSRPSTRAVVFDFDGTLVDSDDALAAPFVALGVPPSEVTFGHVVAEECARLGFTVEQYLAHYDPTRVRAYPGVDDLLAQIDVPWAICSNKVRSYGQREIELLGWTPRVALFADDFGGPKQLAPVLDALDVEGADVIFVGDTDHDLHCARVVGARFALAAWNPRAAAGSVGADYVLEEPAALLRAL
jgi:HAD superfamily hydrolase (TIGR01549 family)